MKIKEGFLDIDDFYNANKNFIKSLGFHWLTYLIDMDYIVRSCKSIKCNSFISNNKRPRPTPGNFYSGNGSSSRNSNYNRRPDVHFKKVCELKPNFKKLRDGIDYIEYKCCFYYNNDFLLDILKNEYERIRL